MTVRVLILHAPGTNRDREAALACRLAGGEPEIVHLNQLLAGERRLLDYGFLVLPGGFSYGDCLGAGTLWALALREGLGEELQRFASDGRPVLGICNGFQALVKAGLLGSESSGPSPSLRSEGFSPLPSPRSEGFSPLPSLRSEGFSPSPSLRSEGFSPLPSIRSERFSPLPARADEAAEAATTKAGAEREAAKAATTKAGAEREAAKAATTKAGAADEAAEAATTKAGAADEAAKAATTKAGAADEAAKAATTKAGAEREAAKAATTKGGAAERRLVTLTRNRSGRFECRWVYLRPEPGSVCLFTRGLEELLYVPVAHGEGNLAVASPALVERLRATGQVALTYVDAEGRPAGYPHNPNGSAGNVAGISNAAGNVLGLMPHPEDHIFSYQHPRWTRGEHGGMGLALFINGVRAAGE